MPATPTSPPVIGLYSAVYVSREELTRAQVEAKSIIVLHEALGEMPSALEKIAIRLLQLNGQIV